MSEANDPGGNVSEANDPGSNVSDVRVLGIETSCDETAASVVVNGKTVLSSVIASEIDLHVRFGGVVPEIASRCPCRTAYACCCSGVGRSQHRRSTIARTQ